MVAVQSRDQSRIGADPNPFVMWRRLRAILADSIIVALLAHVILVGFATFHVRIQLPAAPGGSLAVGFASVQPVLFGISTTVILYVVYFLLFEALTAATPGKLIAGLRVVDTSGRPASPWQAVVRNLFRPLDAAGAYILGGLVAAFSRRKQRIGDRSAGTIFA